MQTNQRKGSVGIDSLELYLREIGKVPLISSAEEERELAERIRRGDEAALEKFVASNLRFVVSVAKGYRGGLPLIDLISAGNEGLIKAAKRFDETRGFKFISYAVWWIRQAILTALATQSRTVRLPLNKVSDLVGTIKITDQLEQELGRGASEEEIIEAVVERLKKTSKTTRSADEIRFTLSLRDNPLSLDQPFGSHDKNNNHSPIDILEDECLPPPDKPVIDEALKAAIDRALDTLTAREAEVLILYFGLNGEKPLTLQAIGDRYNLTRERVRQIRDQALQRLRHPSRLKALAPYRSLLT